MWPGPIRPSPHRAAIPAPTAGRRTPARGAASCTMRPMTVPGRTDAAALLLSLDPPAWHLRHSRAVAEIAAWLADRIAARGAPVDRPLVEAAALLHDVDKILPDHDPAGRLPHGEGSAAWLTRHGHGELARAVAHHPVTCLLDGERFRRWAAFASREERIVAYADKRAGQRLETMAERFASWDRRYPDAWSADQRAAIRLRATRLEADVCRAAGVGPTEVARLAWTGAAFRAARSGLPARARAPVRAGGVVA